MWIDSHCHLDAAEFDVDRDAVVAAARTVGVRLLVVPAVAAAHFDTVRALAHRHGAAYALGIHPLYVDRADLSDLDRLQQALAQHRDDPRLVAVGEIGLDHFVPGLDRERQKHFYIAQLKLARASGLPVILHVRRSADALLHGLRRIEVAGGIAHAFNGSRVQADAFAQRGLRLGFGGAMTFERARRIRALAAGLPETVPVLETDAPDMPPHWRYRTAAGRAADAGREAGPVADGTTRGDAAGASAGPVPGVADALSSPAPAASSRNEPAELPRIAETLAALRGWSPAHTAEVTVANTLAALPRLQALW